MGARSGAPCVQDSRARAVDISAASQHTASWRRSAPISQYVLMVGGFWHRLTAMTAAALVIASCGGSSSPKGLSQAAGRLPPDDAVTTVLPVLHVRVAPDGRSWSTGSVEGARFVALRQWFGQTRSQAVQPGADLLFAAEARVATLPTDVTEAMWAKSHVPGKEQVMLTDPAGHPADLVESFDAGADQYQASFFSDHVDYWMELIASRSPQHDSSFNKLVSDWLHQLHLG